MKIGDAVGSRAINTIVSGPELEEIYKRRKEASLGEDKAVEAAQKVEEVKRANTQTTLKMMDRHNEMVKKSQELNNAQAKKRAIERMAQKRVEEHREVLAEMAARDAERHDLLEAARLKKL